MRSHQLSLFLQLSLLFFCPAAFSETLSDTWKLFEPKQRLRSFVLLPDEKRASLGMYEGFEKLNLVDHGRRSGSIYPDGNFAAYVDNTNLLYNYDHPWDFKMSSGYLVQTVLSEPYAGRHLHISGFVKTELPEISILSQKFKESLEAEMLKEHGESYITGAEAQELVAEKVNLFETSIKENIHYFDYGLTAFVHMPNTIVLQHMTQAPTKTFTDWMRLNVEVGIPLDSTHISIVFWSRGFNKVLIDHFAVVEHGDIMARDVDFRVDDDRWRDRFYRYPLQRQFYEFLRSRESSPLSEFRDLSFE